MTATLDVPAMTTPARRRRTAAGRDWVAIVLAVGLALALNLICIAVLYDALFSDESGLSENATQILIASFGGITGILGSYIGFRAGAAQEAAHRATPAAAEPPKENP